MKRFLLGLRRTVLFASLLSLPLALLLPFSQTANAASAYDHVFSTTENLILQKSFNDENTDVCATQSHELDWSEVFVDESYWTDAVGDAGYATISSAWASALSNGNGWVVNQKSFPASGSTGSFGFRPYDKWIQITFTAASANYVNFATWSGIDYAFLQSDTSTMVYRVDVALDDDCDMKVVVVQQRAGTSSDAQFSGDQIVAGKESGTHSYELEQFIFNVQSTDYPEDYEGEYPPDTYTPPDLELAPHFGYNIDDERNLTATYLRNLSDEINAYGWIFNLYTADEDYVYDSESTPLDQVANSDSRDSYYYTFDTDGHYVLVISLNNHPPLVVRDDVASTTLQLNVVDGQAIIGNSANCPIDYNNATCAPQEANCQLITNTVQKMSCIVSKSFDFGVINPSITAFKNLLSSFIVPDSPSCALTLPNVTLPPSNVFPLSEYPQQVCDSTDEVREAVPILSILLNFSLALLCLFLIVAIINRVTRPDKHDIIDGVTPK